jgi:hypothetical protein
MYILSRRSMVLASECYRSKMRVGLVILGRGLMVAVFHIFVVVSESGEFFNGLVMS